MSGMCFGQSIDPDDAQWGQVPDDAAEEDPSCWAHYWSSTRWMVSLPDGAGRTVRLLCARSSGRSEGAVRTHLNNIFTRLDVSSRTAAATS
jgi:hypothetical protein